MIRMDRRNGHRIPSRRPGRHGKGYALVPEAASRRHRCPDGLLEGAAVTGEDQHLRPEQRPQAMESHGHPTTHGYHQHPFNRMVLSSRMVAPVSSLSSSSTSMTPWGPTARIMTSEVHNAFKWGSPLDFRGGPYIQGRAAHPSTTS